MDRDTLRVRLAEAERHLEQARCHVAGQAALIAKLERQGRDTTDAEDLLRMLQELQAMRVADRDLIKRELAQP